MLGKLREPKIYRSRLFLGRALAILGDSLLLSTLVSNLTMKVIGLMAIVIGLSFLWLRKPNASMYGGSTLLLSWICLVLGAVVLIQRVFVDDLVLGVILGLFGIAVGVEGILKARAGE